MTRRSRRRLILLAVLAGVVGTAALARRQALERNRDAFRERYG